MNSHVQNYVKFSTIIGMPVITISYRLKLIGYDKISVGKDMRTHIDGFISEFTVADLFLRGFVIQKTPSTF